MPFERRRPLMVSLRATARVLLVLALFGFAAGTAAAFTPPPEPKPRPPIPVPKPPAKKQLVFPVLGTAQFSDDFGAPRAQGSHEGNDILAPRRALALAAEPGRVQLPGGVDPGRLHALSRRPQRHDVRLHPPQQRSHRRERQPGRLQDGRRLPARASRAAPQSRPASRSASSATRATPTGSIRISISRSIRAAARAVNPYRRLLAARRLLFYAPRDRRTRSTSPAKVVSATERRCGSASHTLRLVPDAASSCVGSADC